MNEESNLSHGTELCPKDNKVCIQHKEMIEIKDILSSQGSTIERVKKDMEIMTTDQCGLRDNVRMVADSVSKMSESIAKVWEMNYMDKSENLKDHTEMKLSISGLDNKIDKVENKSNIDNMKQNMKIANEELEGYKEVEKRNNAIKFDSKKALVLSVVGWISLKITGGLELISEAVKKLF